MPSSRWQREPFRAFFPLGVLLAWIGVGHWLLYTSGLTSTYSCLGHGFVQLEGFLMAFAAGFLLTAIPRRTQSAPPARGTLWVVGLALAADAVAAIDERWVAAQVAYLVAVVALLAFAARRFVGGRAVRRPPPSFVLVPLGVAAGVAGAVLVLAWAGLGAPLWAFGLGRLLVEQGVFLCLVVGVGGLLLPIIGGGALPGDVGVTPHAVRQAAGYAFVGGVILGSLVAEQWGSARVAPLVRAAAVTVGLLAAGAGGPPRRPGLNRRLVWLAAWLVPVGLAASGLWPDYRVASLHVVFIGGFALLAFAVATHVTLGHLGLEELRDGRPSAVIAVGVTFVLAMLARVAADASGAYFAHLGWAASLWLAGSAAWLAFVGPKLLRR